MFARPRGDWTLKGCLVAREMPYVKAMGDDGPWGLGWWATYLSNPNSVNSSLIGISFLSLSFAFSILKVASTDAKVNHNYSDSVSYFNSHAIDKYRPLRLQHAFQHKFCIIVKWICSIWARKDTTSTQIHTLGPCRRRWGLRFCQRIFRAWRQRVRGIHFRRVS